MAIIKNKLKENFSIIPNEIITTKELKDGEYRLLLYLYHLPHNWKVNQEHLATEFDISRMQVNRRISNLKKMNYLEIKKKKVNQEEWEYDYILKIPDVSNMLHHEMLHHEMLQPNNTKYKQILTNNNTKENINKRKIFIKPTFEEISQYCQERKNKIDPQNFIDYYEANGWMVGRNKMKDWKACVRTWEARQKKDKPYQQTTEEKVPEWFGKKIEQKEATVEEQEAMKEMLKEFKE